jgi:hypothetical protein
MHGGQGILLTGPLSWESDSVVASMRKKVAIVQSNYIPWKGYFDLINLVDEFILYDDVQYTRRDWRNRNKIKTPRGLRWLTVPVRANRSQLFQSRVFRYL